MHVRSLAIWCLLLAVAVLNGGTRDALISPRAGERAAHVISTAILCAAILIAAWLSIGWIGAQSSTDAIVIGVEWFVLTVAFEFLAGHYLFGEDWEVLLADYNLARGRVWALVLVANLLAPVWAFWQKTAH